MGKLLLPPLGSLCIIAYVYLRRRNGDERANQIGRKAYLLLHIVYIRPC
jgi:hypothetical protein